MSNDPAQPASAILDVERQGDVLRLALNRPARANALDRDLVDRLFDAFADDALLRDLRALVITGNGEN
ncbi:MAG: enoyl-CoA hydratase, partial [Candidatus Tumulicola sp.]